MSVTADPTDSELVARMASGDREAFAAVFRRYQAVIYRFTRQMLGAREAAEDVTQDVFIALAQNAGRYDPAMGSLTTYLYGIARNLVLQRNKRSRAHVEVEIESVQTERSAEFAAATADPAEELWRSEMVAQMRLAILRLPIRYREVIVLCELNGLTYEEAATVSGCPVGTIRSRLSRARQMLLDRCRKKLSSAEGSGRREQGRGERGEGRAEREQGKGQRAESTKKWLIPTKNNC